jgi:hypothetical protein
VGKPDRVDEDTPSLDIFNFIANLNHTSSTCSPQLNVMHIYIRQSFGNLGLSFSPSVRPNHG